MTNQALTVQLDMYVENIFHVKRSPRRDTARRIDESHLGETNRKSSRRDKERSAKRRTATTVPIVYFYLNLCWCQFYRWNE